MMSLDIFYLSEKLLCLVDSEGNVPNVNTESIQNCVREAEMIAKRMLGCTLKIREQSFILASVELYYGGIGDFAHDWYRAKFPHKVKHNKVSKALSDIQNEEGLRIYLNQKGNGKFKRMDLVIGPKNTAITLLVRNVMLETGEMLGPLKGAPNIVLKKMGILDFDHGRKINFEDDLKFFDIHDAYVKDYHIVSKKRVIGGKDVGFSDDRFGQCEWNFTLVRK